LTPVISGWDEICWVGKIVSKLPVDSLRFYRVLQSVFTLSLIFERYSLTSILPLRTQLVATSCQSLIWSLSILSLVLLPFKDSRPEGDLTRRFQRPQKGNHQKTQSYASHYANFQSIVNCAASRSTVLTSHPHERTIIFSTFNHDPAAR